MTNMIKSSGVPGDPLECLDKKIQRQQIFAGFYIILNFRCVFAQHRHQGRHSKDHKLQHKAAHGTDKVHNIHMMYTFH